MDKMEQLTKVDREILADFERKIFNEAVDMIADAFNVGTSTTHQPIHPSEISRRIRAMKRQAEYIHAVEKHPNVHQAQGPINCNHWLHAHNMHVPRKCERCWTTNKDFSGCVFYFPGGTSKL